MFRAINRFSILTFGFALSTATALADDLPDQEQLIDQPLTEVVFVSENAPKIIVQPQNELDQEVAAIIESELMLNLTARLTPVAPQS